MNKNNVTKLKETHKKLIHFYNNSDKYISKIKTRDIFHYRVIPIILKTFVNKQIKVLDLGCGTGRLLKFIQQRNF